MAEETAGGGVAVNYPQRVELPVLRGQLVSGMSITLLEVSILVWAPGQAAVDARAALVGDLDVGDGSELRFTSAKMQIEHLDSLAHKGPLGPYRYPQSSEPYLNVTWSVDGVPESTQKWSEAGLEVTYSFDSLISAPDGFGFQLSFSPTVIVVTSKPITFDAWVSSWLLPLRQLVSLATGKEERITYFDLELAGEGRDFDDQQSSLRELAGIPDFELPRSFRTLQVYASGITQEPFASQYKDVQSRPAAFHVGRDEVSLLQLLKGWQEASTEHHPLLETYGAFIGDRRQHPRLKYLLLIQALEGLHGFETRADWKARVDQHLDRRAAVLSASALSYLPSADGRFLKENLGKRPLSSLDAALNYCLSTLPIDQKGALGATQLVRGVVEDKRADSVLAALRVVRNDLAHGNRGYDARELHKAGEILERVTRAHMLRVLGCSSAVIERFLGNPSQ
ncbi:hypothetical protein [Modestobacter sp. I12A-02662]|uniref:ApeA N-terminal domain 1-containing protein n=1 Tax=Modestobacter sp. I12A-02662 TaxID=1730496 RepID=UPI0034DF7A61